ncbi:MAG: chromosome segregation protein SMC [Desulfobacteraceae bacterium 4572_35.1]|nr:MAG: chromosome segregation protein SMC [Desulfobacteraceae bacterium 4572_35.1]
MKIRRIEIIGFKSFVDKTVLNFEDGVTAILGPNGCGKSNVIDAIRWVMGEQSAKNLRGQAMEDVIFAGSEKRRARGMAEVTITFANQSGAFNSALNSYSEIMVTRRLYRNGDSEYLLNKVPCRLKDIAELFMDTGVGARAYSIIEQGKIGMILHSRPEERRVLIEEVAGVTKYKVRKRTALRKIDATRQNLIRLGDVISEVQHQLDGLRRQANKAQKFRKLRQQLKELELGIAQGQWCQLEQQLKQREEALQLSVQKIGCAETETAKLDLRLEQQRIRQTDADAAATRVQNQVFKWTSDLQQVENELSLGKQQQTNIAEQITQIEVEMDQLQQADQSHATKVEQLKQDKTDIGLNLKQLQQQRTKQVEQVAQVEAEEGRLFEQLKGLRAQMLSDHSELVRQQGQLDSALKQLELLGQRKQRQEREGATVSKKQLEIGQQQDECRYKLELERKAQADGAVRLEKLRQHNKVQQQQLKLITSSLAEQQQSLQRCKSKLESLQELDANREGYADGVKMILDNPQLKERFVGVIADGITVAAGYEAALAAALGEFAHALCADDLNDVITTRHDVSCDLRCLYQLPGRGKPDCVQFAGIDDAIAVIDLISAKEELDPFLCQLLQGYYCVDSVDPYLAEQLPVGVVLVTATGGCLDWRGTLAEGGGSSVQQLLYNKRRMTELETNAHSDEQKLYQLQRQVEELTAQVDAGRDEERQLIFKQQQQQVTVGELEREQQRLVEESQHWSERAELFVFEEKQWAEEEVSLQQSRQQAGADVARLEKQRQLQQNRETELDKQWQHQRQNSAAQRQRLSQVQIEIAQIEEREKSLISELKQQQDLAKQQQQRRESLRKRFIDLSRQHEDIDNRRQELDLRLQVLVEHRQQEQQLLQQLRDNAAIATREVEECEGLLKQRREQLQRNKQVHASLQLTLQEACLERDHLHRVIIERYQFDLTAVDDRDDGNADNVQLYGDDDCAQAQLAKLRTALDGFGEVNLMAIDEFAALEERFEFLTSQRSDLDTSIDDLQAAINQINRTSRRRFKEAFEQVNGKFKEVFPRLFVGGSAELILTDKSDLLESGVEIVAQPPGKKLQNVTLLSGGEKALTAVALIFAIFQIKPSPFCVLDEVDAPLDDANIGRFNAMVQEMSGSSQFVIITHNTRTMEIADTLFGVTMEEAGVSSLVSVRMEDMAVGV